METKADSLEVPGAGALVEWFGYFPSFHDAEVVSLELHRNGESRLRIHTFGCTSEVSASGHYVTDRHCVVTVAMDDILGMELFDFNHQNVLSDLVLSKVDEGWRLDLGGYYGLQGRIVSARVRLELTPGMPENSIYAQSRSA